MTQEQIIKETFLSKRTVKYAIRKLRNEKAIREKLDLDDLRRKHYRFFRGKTCTDGETYKQLREF